MLSCFGMDSLFGSKPRKGYKEPATISPEETIRTLREHIDRMEKRERFLEHKFGILANEAKERLGKGDKKGKCQNLYTLMLYDYPSDFLLFIFVGAVSIMKKRKLYQAEADKISNIKMTLETQAIHLESAASSAEAFHAMSAGNKTMKKIRQDVGVDQVDDMMVDIQEEMQMAEEVNNAMGQAIDPLMGGVDDDDLMKELEEMDQMDLTTKFDSAGKTNSYFPQVPTSGLSRREEEDYRRLQAELAM